MSEVTKQEGAAQEENSSGTQADPINNIKQEFGRKLGNVEGQIAELTKSTQALLAQLQTNTTNSKQAPAAQEDDLEDLWYKDPAAAARKIEERATRAIEEKLSRAQEQQNRQNATIQSLVKDYPELNDNDSALTKKAVEIYMGMDDADKTSPTAYRLAVKEAAYELGVKPLKKRTEEELDAFAVSGSGSSASARTGSRRAKQDELDPRTVAFAQMVGLNTTDPKVIESLKERSKRTDWTKYR